MHDFRNNVKIDHAALPALKTGNTPTDAQTTGFSRLGYGLIAFLLEVGAPGDTFSGSLKLAVTAKESDDSVDGTSGSGTWTDVDGADLVVTKEDGTAVALTSGAFELDADAECSQIYLVEYRGTKKFAALYLNYTGNWSTGTPLGVTCLRAWADNVPVV